MFLKVSVSRNHVVKTLLDCNFEVYEFIISPSQFGFPYERKRYFLGVSFSFFFFWK